MGLPSEVNWLVSFSKQSWSSSDMICWPISQPNSPEYHPVKFHVQPCPFLQKSCHALTPTSRLPSAYENALCYFQKPFIQYVNMHIFNQLQLHTCNSTHQPSPNLAHLSKSQSHLQWPTHTIIFHIIVTSW